VQHPWCRGLHLVQVFVPHPLHANIVSGYAHFIHWTEEPTVLSGAIDIAREKSRLTRNIDNSAPRMERSRP
jgi:hypothetical protein